MANVSKVSGVPGDLRYTREHEWAKQEAGRIRVGITAYAQEQLGDVVFVELPKVGAKVTAHQAFGVVESVKAVSDLFAPMSGQVAEVNAELTQKPETVNADPYDKGWMLVVTPSAAKEWDGLLTAAQYEEFLAQGGH
jgi:glycine cleavage system H protein